MLLVPDPETAYLDPFTRHTTLNLRCLVGPVTGEMYSRDPRQVARKAELYLQQTGIADTSFWGPECEFYIFDSVRFDQNQHEGYYHLDAIEGVWNSGREREIGNEPASATSPGTRRLLPPASHLEDLRPGCSCGSAGRAVDRGAPPRGRDRQPGRDRHAGTRRCSRPPTTS